MDQEMGEALEWEVFLGFEIDVDYEFDAPRYFDLGREESPAEAREAELWFATAGSYPPSPLIAKINSGTDVQVESVNILSNLITLNPDPISVPLDDPVGSKFSVLHESDKEDVLHVDNKSTVKSSFSKGSTLMKPTISHLAKQNRQREMKAAIWSWKPAVVGKERTSEDPNDVVHQAAKRQKLERGHLCKVVGLKQQADLIHKIPQKKNRSADCGTGIPRLRLTVPREPELETARRAVSSRFQKLRSADAKHTQEKMVPITSSFKARPLNRKILEAPSLPLPQKSTPRLPNFKEFNFRTHDRAMQHSAASSLIADNHVQSELQSDVTSSKIPQHQVSGPSELQNDEKKAKECKSMLSKFRARPLNKKIFCSRGDISRFRSTKHEVTNPKEFKFASTQKCQQPPLTELFNKLSLTCEALQTASLTKLPPHVAKVNNEEMHLLGRSRFYWRMSGQHICKLRSNMSWVRGMASVRIEELGFLLVKSTLRLVILHGDQEAMVDKGVSFAMKLFFSQCRPFLDSKQTDHITGRLVS